MGRWTIRSTADEERLCEACRQGYSDAENEFIRFYGRFLDRKGQQLRVDVDVLPDLIQETLAAAIVEFRVQRANAFTDARTSIRKPIRGWLCVTLHNRAVSERRKSRKTQMAPLEDHHQVRHDSSEDLVAAHELAGVLNDRESIALLLLVIEDYTSEEAARLLSTPDEPITARAVYQRCHRALEKLDRALNRSPRILGWPKSE